jgi:hypothetical protein
MIRCFLKEWRNEDKGIFRKNFLKRNGTCPFFD